MESHLGVLPFQQLECKYILSKRQRVKVWQVDLSWMRRGKGRERRGEESDSNGGEKQLDEKLLRFEQNWESERRKWG